MMEISSSPKDLIRRLALLPVYVIEIGVIEGDTIRKYEFNPSTQKKEEVEEKGLTNAQLMYIHEHGSDLNNIPDRPVLHMTVQYAKKELLKKTISKAIKAYIDSNFNIDAYERELLKLCTRMENYARDIIYSNDGRLKPNSPRTRKSNGSYENHPLFDTGQLAKSITCTLRRKDKVILNGAD